MIGTPVSLVETDTLLVIDTQVATDTLAATVIRAVTDTIPSPTVSTVILEIDTQSAGIP